MDLDDPRWEKLEGGYRVPYDPRPALRALDRDEDQSEAWRELWEELHHQGDVGLASYAAASHIVRAYVQRGKLDWNAYQLLSTIELARHAGNNPQLPDDLRSSYEHALQQLSIHGLKELRDAEDHALVRSILALVALQKELLALGRLAWDFNEEELRAVITKIDELGL